MKDIREMVQELDDTWYEYQNAGYCSPNEIIELEQKITKLIDALVIAAF